jgi:hypothetical protein
MMRKLSFQLYPVVAILGLSKFYAVYGHGETEYPMELEPESNWRHVRGGFGKRLLSDSLQSQKQMEWLDLGFYHASQYTFTADWKCEFRELTVE